MCPPSYYFPPPPLDGWPAFPSPKATANVEDQRAALSDKQDLEHDLSELLSQIRSGLRDTVALEKAVLNAQQHSASLDAFLSKTVDPKFYNERRQDTSTVARQTFDVVELLEMILEHLEIPDILRMSQVSRSIYNSVKESTRLQTKLSLRAAPADSHLYMPFQTCFTGVEGGFSCYVEPFMPPRLRFGHRGMISNDSMPQNHASTIVRAQFFPFVGQRLAKIGSTYRRMFCCQPPIKKLNAYVNCCHRDLYWDTTPETEAYTITAEDGLTIGHLYDYAKKLMEEHRWCPHAASQYLLEDDGAVKTGLYFQGFMDLLEKDPVLQTRTERDEASQAASQRYAAREAEVRAYGAAKIQAHDNGEPIPTLHEFEATNAGIDWIEVETARQNLVGGPFGPPPPPMTTATLQNSVSQPLTPSTFPPILPPTTSNNITLGSNATLSTSTNNPNNATESEDQPSANDAMGSENAESSSLDQVDEEV